MPPSASVTGRIETPEGDLGELTFEPLDSLAIQRSVQSDQAGAIALFIGTTRDSFKGQKVIRLEYEAYTELALRTLVQILRSARDLAESGHDNSQSHHPAQNVSSTAGLPGFGPPSALIRCAIHHRLGEVPVGEASIVIAVSSPHRKEAFKACEWILEEVKLKAQIWKREWYESEAVVPAWKENFPPGTKRESNA